jgi:hypothetical protein
MLALTPHFKLGQWKAGAESMFGVGHGLAEK